MTPARMRMSVVLPAPFAPSRPNMPVGTTRSTPSRATTPPRYVLVRPEISISIGFLDPRSGTGTGPGRSWIGGSSGPADQGQPVRPAGAQGLTPGERDGGQREQDHD